MAKLILKAPFYGPKSKTPAGKGRSGYAEYIATREGVEVIPRSGMADYIGERKGSNGLFSDKGVPIELSKIKAEIDSLKGNMWGLIFSLTRADAERLGYNSAEQWMNLLRSRRNDIAFEMHIKPENLRWYAAYHQKEKNPHVHMLVWSENPGEPYLTVGGIERIKKVISDDIFRQDKMSIYQKQTEVRDEIKEEFRKKLSEIAEEIRRSSFDSPALEEKLLQLSERLSSVKGKKVYGYLRANDKKLVNEIVKTLAENEKISALYDVWYQCRCEEFRTYTDKMPEKIPLEENEEFKSIRNAVVRLASDLGVLPERSDPDLHYDYEPRFSHSTVQKAKEMFESGNLTEAEDYLLRAGRQGNQYAYAYLGDCYLRGKYLKKDTDLGEMYLSRAAEAGIEYANYRLGKFYLSSSEEDVWEYAEECLQFSTEKGNGCAAYALYQAYRDGKLSGGTGLAKRYLRRASELGFYPAEYRLLVELMKDNPDEAEKLLKSAAGHGSTFAVYRLGKMLFAEGKTEEALDYLERAAENDPWVKTQLGLLYYYKLDDAKKGLEHLNEASERGYAPAKEAQRSIAENRNALIVTGIINLFYYASEIIEEDGLKESGHGDGIDSRQKREIRAKRNAQNLGPQM